MARKLYELCGVDPKRVFSPFCWRIRMALAHKGLEHETVPWRFTEKQVLSFAGSDKVPVLVDGDRIIADSWAIAQHLEDNYPEGPRLFSDRGLTRFVGLWTDSVLHPGVAGLIVADVLAHLGPDDVAYFTESRVKRFGKPLDQVVAGREQRVAEFRRALYPLRNLLQEQPFLGGAAPDYADYTVFGAFQWARCVSAFALLEKDDAVHAWRERLLDAFGGLARQSPCSEAA